MGCNIRNSPGIGNGHDGRMVEHRIVELREAHGWSQEELGRRIGRSKSVVSRLESGETQLTLDMAKRIAQEFGVSIAEVLKLEGVALAPDHGVGFAEELLPYTSKAGDSHVPAAGTHEERFVVDTDAVDAAGIRRGDVVIVDDSASAVARLAGLEVVRVRLHPPEDFMKPVTLLRQFVPPRLLVTNSTQGNGPSINMDEQDAHIVGVVKSTHRRLLRPS